MSFFRIASKYLVFLLLLFLVSQSAETVSAQWPRPNILLIAADDYGVDASELYTSGPLVPPTPNISELASRGVTFDNVWANPACSPTRATIMTGRYGFRTGVTWVVGRFTPPGELDVDGPTLLPKLLQARGYATALIGKWHLTSNPPGPPGLPGPADGDPNRSGFDYWAGFVEGALLGPAGPGYFNWRQVIQGIPGNCQNFATTENVDQALGFIQSQSGPWFVSLNLAAPHFPYQLPPKHLVDPAVVEDVVDQLGSYTVGFNAAGNVNTRQRRSAFNALVSAMDTEIGRLLASVDLENTYVVFMGDNGTQGGTRPPFSQFNVVVDPADPARAKNTLYEGGIRVPLVVAGPGVWFPGSRQRALVNSTDLYCSFTESERMIQASLMLLTENRTCFVIAHRLSTIAHADRIVVLQAGQIAEIGTHETLMNSDGKYREMVELQTRPPQRA